MPPEARSGAVARDKRPRGEPAQIKPCKMPPGIRRSTPRLVRLQCPGERQVPAVCPQVDLSESGGEDEVVPRNPLTTAVHLESPAGNRLRVHKRRDSP